LWTAFLAVAAFIVFSPKNESLERKASTPLGYEGKPQQTEVEVPVDFMLPLYTKSAALVCPLAVAFDRRDGYGLKGAMDAHLSIFGHEEGIEKLGCQEWREGLPVSLSDEGQQQAKEWETEKLCGMASFTEGYISSCDLRNATKEEDDLAAQQRSEQGPSKALQDPSKVRLMECIGVNPWKEKPTGWTPPTKEECAALEQKLGATDDAREAAAVPDAPSEEVASLIADEEKLNDKCRGGSGDDKETLKACNERDLLYEKIKAKKWCWGHDGQVGADRTWEPCHDDSSAPPASAGAQVTPQVPTTDAAPVALER